MDLMYDYDADGYYWQLFDDPRQPTSQLFDSKSEAYKARDEHRLIWS